MEDPAKSRSVHMDHTGLHTGCLRIAYRIAYGLPMGCLWAAYGLPKGCLWDAYGMAYGAATVPRRCRDGPPTRQKDERSNADFTGKHGKRVRPSPIKYGAKKIVDFG